MHLQHIIIIIITNISLIEHCEFTSDNTNLNTLYNINMIGTGTFGRVYLVRHRPTNKYYAMKTLKKTEVVRLKQVEHINSEKQILASIKHPFIVNLYVIALLCLLCTWMLFNFINRYRSFQDEKYLFMIMEYVIGGELFSHLRRAGRFNNEVTRFYAAEIVLALEYLHSLDIVYRDLKPENLLIDQTGHIKITDFGFSKRVVDRWVTCVYLYNVHNPLFWRFEKEQTYCICNFIVSCHLIPWHMTRTIWFIYLFLHQYSCTFFIPVNSPHLLEHGHCAEPPNI